MACRHDVDSLKWLYQRKLGIFLLLVREVEKFLKYQQKEYDWPYVIHFGGHHRAIMELDEWQKEKQQDNDKARQQTQQGEQ